MDTATHRIEFSDAPRRGPATLRPIAQRGLARAALWLAPLCSLAAIALAFGFVRQGPDWLFGWVFGALFALMLGWIAVSVFWPARAERGCPQCKELALERVDPRSTAGIVCASCGWRDDAASGWLLAEEETEELETIVLEQRAQLRRDRANATR